MIVRAAAKKGAEKSAPFFVDFETRSQVDLTKAGVHKYARDCEILCLAFGQVGGPVRIWAPDEPLPADLFNHVEAGGPLSAWNAYGFERLIWPATWPSVDRWIDTAAEARALGVPGSLERAGEFFGVEQTKDTKGRRLMLRLSRSEGRIDPDEVRRLKAYCVQDVRSEMAISKKVKRLTPAEIRAAEYTNTINDRGLPVDTELATAASKMWDEYTARIDEEVNRITGGIGGRQTGKLTAWLGMDNLRRETIDDALKTATGSKRRVLELRREIGCAAAKKFDAVLAGTEPDGRLRGTLTYHGARTGRWSGRRFQPQNLARGCVARRHIDDVVELVLRGDIDGLAMVYPSVGQVLGSLVRPTIQFDGVACDYGQIEARGIAWAAGQNDLLESFRAGRDVYTEMAKAIGPNVSRQIGKMAILGAGYGLGGRGFQHQCPVDISPAFAQRVIDRYRCRHQRIVKFWRQLERASIKAVETGSASCGCFEFRTENTWLFARLPSGRDIAFYEPRIGLDRFDRRALQYTGTHPSGRPRVEDSYGGKLAENVISGLCRDLLLEACYRLEDAGYPVVLTVHDEVLVEGDDSREVERIMSVVPDWAEGLPIVSEAQSFRRYSK